MNNSCCSAKLLENNKIKITFFSHRKVEGFNPSLLVNNKDLLEISVVNEYESYGSFIVECVPSKSIQLGNSYKICESRVGIIPLDVSDATNFKDFDKKYFYEGNDLGANYSKNETKFVLWAPLASKVVLKIKSPSDTSFSLHQMNREETGTYSLTLKGNYLSFLYKYLVINNEIETEVTDPYAKGSTLNGEESVIIDFKSISIDDNKEKLPLLKTKSDSVIYEANVRDFTISNSSNIQNKGKFLGLSETNRTTIDGLPAGVDYLSSLGVTHLQLLPIFDFKTVDETNPDNSYNWGYDPAQYFVPEGSYGSTSDPLSRIVDLKNMVSTLHSCGIRVVMDVVFNHVYRYENSVFEKVVPNYYFRKNVNGELTNCSWCGNDLANERPMVKKLILDACKHWIDEYFIDGFRFDLMGLIDCDLLNEIKEYAYSKDSSFLLYGEGWEMVYGVTKPVGSFKNGKLIPEYSFFNDKFREAYKYFFVGDDRYWSNIESAYFGNSAQDKNSTPLVISNENSINYVECHDNKTLYDFIVKCDESRSENENLDILNAINGALLLSYGIPFIHMGQEIGQSKWNEDNTYNKGDKYNKFSYSLLKSRIKNFEFVKQIIKFRKEWGFACKFDEKSLVNANEISRINGLLQIKHTHKGKTFTMFFNQSNCDIDFELETTYKKVICSKDFHFSKQTNVIIPSKSLTIFIF